MPDNTLILEALDIQDAANWRWRLKTPGGAFVADHTVKLDPACWQYAAMLDLYAHLRRHVAPDHRRADETQRLREIGDWLGAQVLGAIGPKVLDRAPVTVRIAIPAGPAADGLFCLPLELAYVHGQPLAVQRVSLVFEPAAMTMTAKQPTGDRLRVLALFSLPVNASLLNLRQERYRLKRRIRELAANQGVAVELRVLQYGVTPPALQAMLDDGDGWDVLHFSGHGLANTLVLEQEDGRAETIDSEQLIEWLYPVRHRLKWITLSACWSAAVAVEDLWRWLSPAMAATAKPATEDESTATGRPLAALAQRLAARLDCAVLAMRYPVGDAFAIDLGEWLYGGMLEKHQSLTQALQAALPKAVGNPAYPPLSVVTPALFGRAAELRLATPAQSEVSFQPASVGLALFPEEPELVVGRVQVLSQASQALASRSGKTGVLFHGMAGAGKTTCALEHSTGQKLSN